MIVPLSSKIPGPMWPCVVKVAQKRERVLPKKGGYFVHVTSRVRGQAFLLGQVEKEAFRELALRWAEFSGLTVVTYCVMSNHVHLLLWVPEKEAVSHEEAVRRLKQVWSKEKVKQWCEFYALHNEKDQQRLDDQLTGRMYDLAEFMRVLKHGFSLWFNRKHACKGAFWDSRYRSVVVESSPLALLSVAAYVDLNPVRAGIVSDPLDYRWSGYAAACGGAVAERKGLEMLIRLSRGHLPAKAERVRTEQLLGDEKVAWQDIGPRLEAECRMRAAPEDWGAVQAAYRIWLYSKGESRESVDRIRASLRDRNGFDEQAVLEEFERRGEVPVTWMLRHRVQTLTRGVAIGREAFLSSLLAEHRGTFGAKRSCGGRKLRGKAWLGLEAMRLPGGN